MGLPPIAASIDALSAPRFAEFTEGIVLHAGLRLRPSGDLESVSTLGPRLKVLPG